MPAIDGSNPMAIENKNSFTPEVLAVPENDSKKFESGNSATKKNESPEAVQAAAAVVAQNLARRAPVITDPFQKEVESVLTENIGDIYKQLPQDKKALFKQKGEEVASQITAMVKSGMLKIKKILHLIREWLLIIPGVNKFFLEQEAKIKTDKIQQLYEREHAVAL